MLLCISSVNFKWRLNWDFAVPFHTGFMPLSCFCLPLLFHSPFRSTSFFCLLLLLHLFSSPDQSLSVWYRDVFLDNSSLFLLLWCFSSFSLIIWSSELCYSVTSKLTGGRTVFLGTTPQLLAWWETVSLLQWGIRFDQGLE